MYGSGGLAGAGTALVVEDDEGIRMLLTELLGVRGWTVETAFDGPSGLDKVRTCGPDVVLLDLGLPGMDGLEVLRRIKIDPETSGVPVVVVTAWDDAELTSQALDAGAHDYVRKPFDIGEIGSRVAAAARTKAVQDKLAAKNEELRKLASMDALTGVANRRALDTSLVREIAHARRSGQPLSVLIVDADHFKDVNDGHGHAAGDDVLRGLAQLLERRSRAGDIVGRWGGEEFVLIARDTDRIGAATLAEDIRCSVEETSFDGIDITTSVGCATWASFDEDPEALMHRCDLALYAAKASGRNTVCSAPATRGHLRVVA